MSDSTPIAEYALLGDLRTAALVSRSGAVDWLCLPRFDSGTCFGALLDPRAGTCVVELDEPEAAPSAREYLDGTLVLETILRGEGGEARVLDCLLLGEERGDRRVLLRVVEGLRGTVRIRQRVAPRFDYGILTPWIRHHGSGLYSAIGGDDGLLCFSDAGLGRGKHDDLVATATVRAEERVRLVVEFRRPETLEDEPEPPAPEDLDAALDATIGTWREWSQRAHPAADGSAVRRSALVLKALTYRPTGAMVAAATTSLPEGETGTRTWDYRYAWIRDAHLASGCLTDLGYEAEAGAFRRFIERSAAGSARDLHMFYGVDGERRLHEVEIPELRGWDGAQPVRIGNNAAGQVQLDAYGHLVAQSWRWYELGHPPDDDYWRFIVDLVDAAAERWQEPDAGLWERRGDGKHFVYSKVQCWVATHLGLRLAEECMRKAPERRWRKARDEIREAVLRDGFDERRGTFVQAFGERALDAAVLRLPAVGFLAPDDPRMVSTADVIAAELGDGGLLRRYDADDGLPGREGAFLACTFWLAELLSRQGRAEAAREWFDRAVATANDLGLFSEEFDPGTRRMLGNFPQALTHLAHVDAALALAGARATLD